VDIREAPRAAQRRTGAAGFMRRASCDWRQACERAVQGGSIEYMDLDPQVRAGSLEVHSRRTGPNGNATNLACI